MNIALLTVVIPAIKENKCPYCGAPLRITKVGKDKKFAGEIRIGCSRFKLHNRIEGETTCHFYASLTDWMYVLLKDNIDDALINNEYLDNEKFITNSHYDLNQKFKKVRQSISKKHDYYGFNPDDYAGG